MKQLVLGDGPSGGLASIMPEVMEAFFRAIARIALREPRQIMEVPAVEDGADEAVVQERTTYQLQLTGQN